MTDEEARRSIIDRHGQKANWLARNLIDVYERHRAKGCNVLEALKLTDLCYLASIGAATYDDETDRYRSNYDSEIEAVPAGEVAGGAG